jgi:hypothetical protein
MPSITTTIQLSEDEPEIEVECKYWFVPREGYERAYIEEIEVTHNGVNINEQIWDGLWERLTRQCLEDAA